MSKGMPRRKPKRRQSDEQAEALGEPSEDPLLLFSVLYSFWVTNFVAFDGDAIRELATQFLTLAEKQGATGSLMIGHRLMGNSLLLTGELAEGRGHFDRALALYDPARHRPLATRFGQDIQVATLTFRSLVLWCLAIRGCARGRRPGAQGCARDRPSRHLDVCAPRTIPLHSVRKLRESKSSHR